MYEYHDVKEETENKDGLGAVASVLVGVVIAIAMLTSGC